MKSIYYYMILAFIVTLVACGSSKVTSAEDNVLLEKIVNDKSFEIISNQAQPQLTNSMVSISNSGLLPPGSNAGRIDLIGNSNYLKIEGDSIKAYLPYFGERQMGVRYGSNNTGIEFEGIPEDYKLKQGKKNSYEIRFNIQDKNANTENYNVIIQVYPNLSSSIYINSSQRFPIRYSGRIDTIEKE